MRMLVATMVLMVGCVGSGDYGVELDELNTVTLLHTADAVAVVSGVYGVELNPDVSWVVEGMRDESGNPVGGVHIDGRIWVEWWDATRTSGASADGPAISHTAFAHELAHVAMWLAGTPDPGHTDQAWWGAHGKVAQARAALVAAGL